MLSFVLNFFGSFEFLWTICFIESLTLLNYVTQKTDIFKLKFQSIPNSPVEVVATVETVPSVDPDIPASSVPSVPSVAVSVLLDSVVVAIVAKIYYLTLNNISLIILHTVNLFILKI